jgi:hypothetical protein
MATKLQHHVQPRPDGMWEVKRSNGERASHVVKTKAEAEKIARKISINQKTELIIHKKDGTIERSDSHGNDPNPPKG